MSKKRKNYYETNDKLKSLVKNRHYSNNFLREFEYLLNCGAQPHKICGLFSELIDLRDIQTIHLLMEYGYNPDSWNICYPFIKAVESNNTKIVELLYNYGADINLKNFNGDTALHIAVKMGNDNMIMDLINYKCDLYETNNRGETPLHISCINQDFDTIKTLLHFTNPNTSTIVYNRSRGKKVNVVQDVYIHGSVEIFRLLLPKSSLETLYPLTKYSYSTSSSSTLTQSISPSHTKHRLVWSKIIEIVYFIDKMIKLHVKNDIGWLTKSVIGFLIPIQ